MKSIQRYLAQIGFVLAVLLIGGCRQANDVQPTAPDDRGRLVADLSASFDRLLDWSADGQELYYWVYYSYPPVNKGNYQVYALNMQTGSRRLVYDDQLVSMSYTQYAQSPDGQFLYFAARCVKADHQLSGYFLYRISARQTNQAVAIDSSYDSNNPTDPRPPGKLLSVDGTRLVFQHRPDSVRIHNLAAKTAVAFPASQPVAFSPDASRVLLYRNVGLSTLRLDVSLADLSEKPVNTFLPHDQYPNAHSDFDIQWHMDGIRYIYSNSVPGPSGLFMWNATQQKSTLVRAQPEGESFVSGTVRWSRDSQRIVFYSEPDQLSNNPRQFYYVTDLSSLKSNKVATVARSESERSSAWSPPMLSYNNTQLAYAIGGKVYVVALP